MAAGVFQLGWQSTITVDDLNVGDFVSSAEVGGRVTGNLTLRRTNPSSDNSDKAGYEGKEYGIIGGSLTLNILDDTNGDAAQDLLMDDFLGGVKRWVRVRPHVGTGFFEFTFKLVLSGCTSTMENGGIVRWDISGDSDGTITDALQ